MHAPIGFGALDLASAFQRVDLGLPRRVLCVCLAGVLVLSKSWIGSSSRPNSGRSTPRSWRILAVLSRALIESSLVTKVHVTQEGQGRLRVQAHGALFVGAGTMHTCVVMYASSCGWSPPSPRIRSGRRALLRASSRLSVRRQLLRFASRESGRNARRWMWRAVPRESSAYRPRCSCRVRSCFAFVPCGRALQAWASKQGRGRDGMACALSTTHKRPTVCTAPHHPDPGSDTAVRVTGTRRESERDQTGAPVRLARFACKIASRQTLRAENRVFRERELRLETTDASFPSTDRR